MKIIPIIIRITLLLALLLLGTGVWVRAYAFDQLAMRTLVGIPIHVTAYTPSREECDSTPYITASNKKVRAGIVALSRDLEKKLKVKFGDFVVIEGIGTYDFQDRTSRKLKLTADIFMWTKEEAMEFGRKQTRIYTVE